MVDTMPKRKKIVTEQELTPEEIRERFQIMMRRLVRTRSEKKSKYS